MKHELKILRLSGVIVLGILIITQLILSFWCGFFHPIINITMILIFIFSWVFMSLEERGVFNE